MDPLSPPIRNAVRALILRVNRILLLRECEEEIGSRVEVHDLVCVADCFKPRDTVPGSTRHLVEFLCSVPDDYVPVNGPHPDKHQVEVIWARLNALASMPLYPRSLRHCLEGFSEHANPVYQGTLDW